ncbi:MULTISPECIES: peptidoglycan D,D-transpeptidase FtsI family protein [Legionella]|uniref:Peptidoglycan D,D-transpeptidase FtsI n=1 Tax=Legionella septentrionalis TaxID=2498109 RepID=A0A3S0VNJ6_9GAMM|nr:MULTISPECIES: penicillin-binding transpeptidase domain-containing protein [Legionella]MCP0914318.1 penicillin-binding transpeptidase domain-containing protein [Legionella sp. 27cVA30]RUQ89021.1 penicillin-binding protein 2 [Legionella septentrionalis]RUR00328.1 penicillin-binding protein 2 [Legionella septentrionalis]RUR11815.1 penicillin-binding protein 2 [Legionella septentrionalis]RUR17503.1 penicillin-binding protein 2 [Legionella septentrionalis]
MKIWRHQARLWVVSSFFVLLLLTLVWRMYDLTIMNRQFLQGQGHARSIRLIDIPAYRGMITDRQGIPLAVSTPLKSVWVNPKEFAPSKEQLNGLSNLLSISTKQIQKRVKDGQGRGFIYLKRQLTPMLAKKIESLNISGINFQEEFKRYYPQADSTAQLVGFTNVDDNGIEGLELAYQHWLMGVVGKKRVVKDRMGRIIEELDMVKEPRAGNELRLSIDSRIQYFAYHELQDTLLKFGAKSGSVVVLDTQTGEVLAVANAPSFNPNARKNYTPDFYRNKAITDVFEPGSVMKPFAIASALESGNFTPETIIDTRPSRMMVHGRVIRDIHNYGVLDVTGVLQRSSNVGVTKMVLTSPPEQLIGLLMRSGIGQRTESGYPGESEGTLVRVADANPFVLATLGFGYGMSLSALQLAKSYLIFANQGRTMPVTLLHYDRPVDTTQVISVQTANQVLKMMEAVLGVGGTGKQAAVPGYRVAGKTGTARIAGKQGYEAHRHIASFVGIAPVSNPRLIVAVVIHEPTLINYYGGVVAAPLFSKVMGTALRILDIQPDESTLSPMG